MKPGAEVSQVELSAKQAEVALRSYEIVGYRIVGLAYEGAFVPGTEETEDYFLMK